MPSPETPPAPPQDTPPAQDSQPAQEEAQPAAAQDAQQARRLPRGITVTAIAAAVVVVLAAALIGVLNSRSGSHPGNTAASREASQAAANPELDTGTSLSATPAPGFTLTDQTGATVSLSQFHGKAVVIAFVDSQCTTVCPLTTVSMTEAVSMLGAAGHQVQLLGINANPDATTVADVRAYTVAHQMTNSWDFLTGSPAQLATVWKAYHVYVAASHGDIDHEPAVYLIDPSGRERTLYLTQMSYASVAQQAALIAGGLSRLLPGQPAPHGAVSMTEATSVGPGTAASLPVIGGASAGGTVPLGPGHPHVVVFLASWDSEISNLPAQLRALADYQAQAVRHGWPTVVAVDETQVETSASALPRLLASPAGGTLPYPVLADRSGRLADGYGVQDLPWVEITGSSGKIGFQHDGWLTAAALAQAVQRTSHPAG